MQYADFTYYTTEYRGKAIKSEDDFSRFARKAERRLDAITGNKLEFNHLRKGEND